MIKYYHKRDMLKSTQVMVDSRDTLNRVRAEAALAKMEDGQQSKEFNHARKKQVLSKLKLALNAPSEEEQINHVNAATENLKDLLVE